MSLYIARLNVH